MPNEMSEAALRETTNRNTILTNELTNQQQQQLLPEKQEKNLTNQQEEQENFARQMESELVFLFI